MRHTSGMLTALFLTASLLASGARAQDDSDGSWVFKSDAGLSLTQSSFSDAWAGDEVGTVSWALTSNSEAGKQLTSWANWANGLVLQFGQTHQQDADRDRWLAPRKSADKITYRGIVRFNYGGLVDPFVALDLDSQFFQRRSDQTLLFTPTTISQSAGVARAIYDTEQRRLVTRFGFAAKERINRFGTTNMSGEFETVTTTEGGFEWFTVGRLADVEERTVYKSELRLFKAVATSQAVATRMHWAALDVDWQNTLSNKITKWLSFNLFWQLLFDKQIDLRGQFKQTLGVGLTWQLI